MHTFISASSEQTASIASILAKQLTKGDCLFFFGDLGSGKTTFIKTLASILTGISSDLIQSPTFQYVHQYDGTIKVCHFDLYRLEHEADFFDLGLDELITDDAICCIEWSERLSQNFSKNGILIKIKPKADETREISITLPRDWKE